MAPAFDLCSVATSKDLIVEILFLKAALYHNWYDLLN